MVLYLPHVNAALNALATIFLCLGYLMIRRQHVRAHRNLMVACYVTSVVFFVSYVVYHVQVPSKPFPTGAPAVVRTVYYAILISHILLAITVPVLATTTLVLGLKDRRARHRRWARWTFPIWLYVSITGVLVYGLLYHGIWV